MGEKHPDRTNEWNKQQQALKNMKTTTISSKDSKEEKKLINKQHSSLYLFAICSIFRMYLLVLAALSRAAIFIIAILNFTDENHKKTA